MRKIRWRRQELVIGIFLLVLLAMLLGITVPVALGRLGLVPAAGEGQAAEEPSVREEPVNFAEAYPFEETGVEEDEASFYEKLKTVDAGLKSYVSTVETFCNENVPGRTRVY